MLPFSLPHTAASQVEYVAQHQLEQLDPWSSPLKTLLARFPGNGGDAHAQAMRGHLARFGLGGEVKVAVACVWVGVGVGVGRGERGLCALRSYG